MRILHLISSVGLLGAEMVVIELSKSLWQMYHCQSIVGIIKNFHNPHDEIADEAIANNIQTVIFPCRGRLDLKPIYLIREFIRDNDIDVVHCHGYKSNFYGLLSAQGKTATLTTNHNWLTSCWKLRLYCFFDGLWIRYLIEL